MKKNVGRQLEHRNLWQPIADDLREAIHRGDIAPGTKLVTADLAEQWGVSRGPVREALMALENEGIVVSTPRQGTIVGTPSRDDLVEIFAVREAIETAAGLAILRADVDEAARARLTSIVEKVDKAWDKVESGWDSKDSLNALKLDFAFHQAVVDLSGNSRFSAIYRHSISQNTHHLKGISPDSWPKLGWGGREAHHAMLAALESGDANAWKRAIAAHYRQTRNSGLS